MRSCGNLLYVEQRHNMECDRHSTSETLLQRLADAENEEAWDEFYRFYAPMVVSFCMKRGCSREAAYDVLQESMVRLFRIMPDFRYDRRRGRFRSFLFTVVRGRRLDLVKREARVKRTDNDTVVREKLCVIEEERADDPNAIWEAEWRRNLIRRARERVKLRVGESTFRSFLLSTIERRPVDEVAAELGLDRNTIYQHRFRVRQLIGDEVESLRRELEDE